MSRSLTTNSLRLVQLLFLGLILIWPAFYNNFPLVYSDTGTYIQSGMEWTIPKDRPVFYGIFIKVTSLSISLWFTIIIQSIIVGFLLRSALEQVFDIQDLKRQVITLIALSFCSGISWYSSQIMPDVWLPIGLLSLVMLGFAGQSSWYHYTLLGLAIIMHNSHILIFGALILIALILRSRILQTAGVQKMKMSALVLCLAIIIMSLTNGIGTGNWSPTRGGPVYLVGRLLDTGILEDYLRSKCDHQFDICKYKDELPANSRELLWSDSSPLQLEGGWADCSAEYLKLSGQILTTPKHLFRFLFHSIIDSFSQLFQNSIGSGLVSGWYSSPDSPPYQQIDRHFNHEVNQYLNSRQNNNLWRQGLQLQNVNFIYLIALVLSCLLLIYNWTKIPQGTLNVCIFLLCFILINAFVTATMANVYDRLQGKAAWILVLIGLSLTTKFYLGNSRSQ